MIFFLINSCKQHCVIIYSFLNQDELATHCLLIGIKDADFNLQCISNAERLFSEMSSPKKHGQLCLYRNFYYDALLVSFTATTPVMTTDMNAGKKIYSQPSKLWEGFYTRLQSSFDISYWRICGVGMKRWVLKDKQDC